MQQQIEEEIEDEIALANEQYQREKDAYSQIMKKRKNQGIRKVDWKRKLSFSIQLFFEYFIEKNKRRFR